MSFTLPKQNSADVEFFCCCLKDTFCPFAAVHVVFCIVDFVKYVLFSADLVLVDKANLIYL